MKPETRIEKTGEACCRNGVLAVTGEAFMNDAGGTIPSNTPPSSLLPISVHTDSLILGGIPGNLSF